MPSALSARRSALGTETLNETPMDLSEPAVLGPEADTGVRFGHGVASEGPLDVFSDINTVKAPKLSNEDIIKDPWELNPQFSEVPREALQGPQWKQVVSARVHVKEPITILEGRASNMTSRHIMRAQGAFGLRHLRFGGNLGTVLALGRGRCSSCPLLLCCRREAAISVATASRFDRR